MIYPDTNGVDDEIPLSSLWVQTSINLLNNSALTIIVQISLCISICWAPQRKGLPKSITTLCTDRTYQYKGVFFLFTRTRTSVSVNCYLFAPAFSRCSWAAPPSHFNDVIMSTTASQITSLTIVYSIVYSGSDQRKHQSSASLDFVRGIHRWPVNSPHKWPVTRKIFPFDDVIMKPAIGHLQI